MKLTKRRKLNDKQTITIIRNNYLKNIRMDLMENETEPINKTRHDIVDITAKIENAVSNIMIDGF